MEKSKAPSFSRDTLDYPEFKEGWNNVPGVYWDDTNQVKQIKYKVNAETRLLISRCNTMEEGAKLLDNDYAQEEKVVNSVSAKLKSICLMECSVPEYKVKLGNYISNLEVALRSVNGFEQFFAPTQVEYLAPKFYPNTLKDWNYLKAHNKGSTTYERFPSFLQD